MTKTEFLENVERNEGSEFMNFCSNLNLDPTSSEVFNSYHSFLILTHKFKEILKELNKTSGNISVNIDKKYSMLFVEDKNGSKIALEFHK